MRVCKSSRGYTLVELLTVVSIVGIVALVTIPALNQVIPQYRIRGAASEAASAMRLVRQKALATRVPWRISFDPNNDRYAYWMLNSSGADMSVASNWTMVDTDGIGGNPGNSTWLRPGVDIRTNTSNPFKDVDCPADAVIDVIFQRDGTVSASPTCSTSTLLTFTTTPSVVFTTTSRWVKYNRYYISVSEVGEVKVRATKE